MRKKRVFIGSSSEELKLARINLVKSTCQVIKNSLALLGIEVVEKM